MGSFFLTLIISVVDGALRKRRRRVVIGNKTGCRNSQCKGLNVCARRQREDTLEGMYRRWRQRRDVVQACSETHLITSHRDEKKLQQQHEIAVGKKKKKKFWIKIQTQLFSSFSLPPSPTPSILPPHVLFSPHLLFNASHTLAYTHTHSPPTLHFLLLFYFLLSISPLLRLPSSLSFSLQHLSVRELGPSLGCCRPGLLAAK